MDTWNVDFASLHRKAAPLQKLVAPVIESGSTNALYLDMAMPSGHGDMGSMGQLREQQKKRASLMGFERFGILVGLQWFTLAQLMTKSWFYRFIMGIWPTIMVCNVCHFHHVYLVCCNLTHHAWWCNMTTVKVDGPSNLNTIAKATEVANFVTVFLFILY